MVDRAWCGARADQAAPDGRHRGAHGCREQPRACVGEVSGLEGGLAISLMEAIADWGQHRRLLFAQMN